MSERQSLLRVALRRAWFVLFASYQIAMAALFLYLAALGIGYVYEAGWYWLALLIGWPVLGFIVLVWVLYEGGNVGPGRR